MGRGVTLIPPDVTQTPQGPGELYVAGLTPAPPGMVSLQDPRVGHWLASEIQQILPVVQPVGSPQPLDPNRHDVGLIYMWVGQTHGGLAMNARAYVRLVSDQVVLVGAVAPEGVLDARDSVLRAIAVGAAYDPAGAKQAADIQRDPNLMGVWYQKSFSSGSIVSDSSMLRSTTTVWVFSDDGMVTVGSETAVMGHSGGLSATGLAQGQPDVGRWRIVNRQLFIRWGNGALGYWAYYVQGAPGRREALLQPPGGERLLLTEYNA